MTIDREKVLQAAQAYIQKKRYDRAVAEYRKLIQQDPEDARILLKIGDLQSKMEAHAEAIATYERVGRQYARQGFTLKAIAVYKQIREIIRKHVPELADRYSHIVPLLAELYSQLGLVSDAVSAYEEVAAQLQRAGQDLEAINVLKKVLALDTANPLPHLRLAEAYSRVHDNDGAITHFGAAANILAELGRYDDALKVLERLLHHRSDPTFARKAAEIYLARGQANDGMLALPKLQICFQADSKDLDTLALLARAFLMIGQPTRAIEVQKEIARIAKEQGKLSVFRDTVDVLLRAAPNDEGVRKLAASIAPAGRSAAPTSDAPIALSDNEIEEISPAPAGDPQEANQLSPAVPQQQVLAEVESLCAMGLQARAIEHLERAILSQPDVVVLRRKLRDILYEQGDFERTAEEMVQIAQIFMDQQAPEYAAEELQAIFTFLADHPVARRMLSELGYAVPGDPQGEVAVVQAEPQPAAGYDPYAAVNNAAATNTSSSPVAAPANGITDAAGAAYQTDEEWARANGIGYGNAATAAATEIPDTSRPSRGPLPAFPFEDEVGSSKADGPFATAEQPLEPAMAAVAPAAEAAFRAGASAGRSLNPAAVAGAGAEATGAAATALAGTAGRTAAATVARDAATATASRAVDDARAASADGSRAGRATIAPAAPHDAGSASPRAGSGATNSEAIEEVLEEAEFFMTRGLVKDARDILEEQLRRAPHHPLLLERLRELEAMSPTETAGSSGTRERPISEGAGATFSTPETQAAPSDRAFDIAASLEAIDALDAERSGSPFMQANQQVDVEEVFAKFKKGLRAQVSETDSQTHYDLGLAYREMDLHGDAIEEFEMAARDPKRECVCYSMIGMIHRETNNVNGAIEAFIKGLHAEIKTHEQENKLYYELADAYESKGIPAEAIYFFKKIAHFAPGYDDPRGSVADRLKALQSREKRQPRAQAASLPDEFDAAFDAMLGGKRS